MFYASATGNMTRDNVAERYDLANGVRVIRTSEIKSISIFVHTSYQEDSAWAQWKLWIFNFQCGFKKTNHMTLAK